MVFSIFNNRDILSNFKVIGETFLILYPKNSQLTSNKHDTNRENLFTISIRRNVPKSDRSQATEREIQRRDVLGLKRGSASVRRTVIQLVGLVG